MAVRLKAQHKQYQWGKVGKDSLVFQLQQNSFASADLDENERYSELWMGTHPNGPSLVESTNQPLKEYLNGSQLPFLFKVLSIDKPLSIQAHPDKTLAEQLHKKFPDIYKDPNHKPELACALTPFEALCGFRPLKEIIQLIFDYSPELKNLLGDEEYFAQISKDSEKNSQEILKELFGKLVKLPEDQVEVNVNQLVKRMTEKGQDQWNEFEKLIVNVNSHFPGDVGVFCLFFLNHLKLQIGESIFLGANLPHCYLSGNIIECMACSDNVIRAGLTPKLKDADTLCSMLNYAQDSIPILKGNEVDCYTRCFPTPIDEFILYRVLIQKEEQSYEIQRPEKQSPAIIICIKGKATLSTTIDGQEEKSGEEILSEGSVIFAQANSKLTLSKLETPLELYYCTCGENVVKN